MKKLGITLIIIFVLLVQASNMVYAVDGELDNLDENMIYLKRKI